MLYSCQTSTLASRGGIFYAVDTLMDAGYPAIDITLFGANGFLFEDNWRDTAVKLRARASERDVIFNQAHAPFGGGYDHYMQKLIPTFPRVFEFCEELGVRQIIVHPLQQGRYYGRERELFDMNMDFYRLAAYYDTLNDPEHFTVCLDIGHVALCGREPQDAIRFLGHDRLGALHVHDVDYVNDLHTIPYLGRIRWDKVIEALTEIDYSGEFTMESDAFLAPYPPDFLPTAAKYMAETTKYLAEKLQNALKEKNN